MTTASLKEKPVRVLARLAKQQGVSGWHAMRKDQLIQALVRKAKSGRSRATSQAALPASRSSSGSHKPVPANTEVAPAAVQARRSAAVARRLAEVRERLVRAKNLTSRGEGGRQTPVLRDRMVLMVRGPHWLHAFWEVTQRSVVRAESALGQDWHGARPVLRLLELEQDPSGSPSERIVREIEIHGGVKNWFIDVRQSMRCRAEIGYLSRSGTFHRLVLSNAVTVPTSPQGDTLDSHWCDIADNCEKIYAMSGGFSTDQSPVELQQLFEERLRRRLGPPAQQPGSIGRHLDGEADSDDEHAIPLDVDAEMVVYGITEKDAYLTIQGEPVAKEPDGTFRVRVEMPNRRQVLPIVARSADGMRHRTVVLAVERNTKTMETSGPDVDEG